MSSPPADPARLAIIGGTGPEGRGLAMRFARAGHSILIGSRSSERAEETAAELKARAGGDVTGQSNLEAARNGDVVILTIPYAGVGQILGDLREGSGGKIVISAIAPVEFRDGRPVALRVEAGSAAQEVQASLPDARVVSAFQTIDSHQLQDLEASLDTDVVVCSDDVEARHVVVELAGELPGVYALSGGRLAASRYMEEVTALLITLNRIYKAHSGIRITGIHR
jgi:8-hydroxy-5-deazaflavin:NADPH oxidoreductase